MKITYHKKFLKQFDTLERRQQEAVHAAIEKFRHSPFDAVLRNHPLKGTMKDKRSISASFDLRLIFVERDGYAVVLMLAVGSHQDVY